MPPYSTAGLPKAAPPVPPFEEECCLLLHQNFVSASQPGNSRSRHLLAALLARGCRVHVVAPTAGYMGGTDDDEIPPDASQLGLTIERVSLSEDYSPFSNKPRVYLEFAIQALRAGIRTRGVTHILSTTPPLPQVIPSILLSVIKGAPLVLEVRDLWPAYPAQLGLIRSRLVIFSMEWVESMAYRYAECLVVTSPAYKKYLCSMGVDPSAIHFLPTGCDPRYVGSSRSRRAAWRLTKGVDQRLVLLYAGSFNEPYDLAPLIAAAERLSTDHPEILWCFAGNGRQLDLIRAAADRLECVRYLGNLRYEDVMDAYFGADIGLVTHADHPVLESALSGKVFDCLAAGLPILSTSTGVTGLLAEKAGSGIITERTPEAISTAVLELQALGGEGRKSRGAIGQSWALETMDASKIGTRFAELLLVERSRSRLRLLLRLVRAIGIGIADAISARGQKAADPSTGE